MKKRLTKKELFKESNLEPSHTLQLMRAVDSYFLVKYKALYHIPHKFFYGFNAKNELCHCYAMNLHDPHSRIIEIKKEDLWRWYKENGPIEDSSP